MQLNDQRHPSDEPDDIPLVNVRTGEEIPSLDELLEQRRRTRPAPWAANLVADALVLATTLLLLSLVVWAITAIWKAIL